MSARLTLIAVLVPVLGLAALVGRAEYASSHGPVWTIPIEGYDPRDILHGRYLEYRYRLHWQGLDGCGAQPDGGHELVSGCCVCLTRNGADGFDPFVRQVSCEPPTDACESTMRSDAMMGPQRYFVPEDHAPSLESALRSHDAAVELTAAPTGEPAVRELLLDRRPWREAFPP